MRKCIDCKVTKPLSEFGTRGGKRSHQLRSYCKACTVQRSRSWKDCNPDYSKKLLERDPNYFKDVGLRNRYGLTTEDKLRMIEEQGGGCAICQGNQRMVVDHDHATGAVRGILCHRCNVRIAVVEDKAFVEKAEKYLRDRGNDRSDDLG